MPTRKSCLQGPLGQPVQGTGAYPPKEAAVCRHRTLGSHGETGTVGLTGYNAAYRYFFLLSLFFLHQWILVFSQLSEYLSNKFG